jgi:hypothetical protein
VFESEQLCAVINFKKLKSICMKKIRLNFRKYGDGALLILVQAIIAALTGNAFFPTTQPTLAEFQTAIDAYATALSAAKNRGKTEVAEKNQRKTELIDLLVSLAMDIMNTADGDELKLVSSGFPLSKDRQPKPPLGMPVISKIENGASLGELDVSINPLPGSRVFLYQFTQDPITPVSEWQGKNSTSIKVTLTNLESGRKYWCRTVAYGTSNQMMVSDAVLSRIVQ